MQLIARGLSSPWATRRSVSGMGVVRRHSWVEAGVRRHSWVEAGAGSMWGGGADRTRGTS